MLDGPYMVTANLPIRYQINVEDGDPPNPKTAQLTQICSSVISEGGYNPIGKSFSVSNSITTVPLNSSQTNESFTATFGTVSTSSTSTNEIYIRIKLTSGQSISALSLESASN